MVLVVVKEFLVEALAALDYISSVACGRVLQPFPD